MSDAWSMMINTWSSSGLTSSLLSFVYYVNTYCRGILLCPKNHYTGLVPTSSAVKTVPYLVANYLAVAIVLRSIHSRVSLVYTSQNHMIFTALHIQLRSLERIKLENNFGPKQVLLEDFGVICELKLRQRFIGFKSFIGRWNALSIQIDDKKMR